MYSLSGLRLADSLIRRSPIAELGLNDRATTGVLTSHPQSRDIHFEQFTLLFHGHELLQDTNLELNYGRRYGLLGPNGCGKSTLLKALGAREIPIPEHIDIYFLDREMAASDMTALEAVMEVDSERAALEKEAEWLMDKEGPEVESRMEDIYERLDALDSDMAEVRAASILHGLGFDKEMQAKKTRDFSGGWRMRISLARALFVEPTFLVLDEPTNHLDLEACVWLEDTLKKWKRILLLVSHSQDFLNGVCTNIIHMHQKKLNYYTGTCSLCTESELRYIALRCIVSRVVDDGGDATFCLSSGRRINRALRLLKIPLLERLASDPSSSSLFLSFLELSSCAFLTFMFCWGPREGRVPIVLALYTLDAHAQNNIDDIDTRRRLRHVCEDTGGERGEPDEEVQVGAGSNCQHEGVHCPLRSRKRQARPAGAVQGEGAGPAATTSALVSDISSILRGNVKFPFSISNKERKNLKSFL